MIELLRCSEIWMRISIATPVLFIWRLGIGKTKRRKGRQQLDHPGDTSEALYCTGHPNVRKQESYLLNFATRRRGCRHALQQSHCGPSISIFNYSQETMESINLAYEPKSQSIFTESPDDDCYDSQSRAHQCVLGGREPTL